MHATVIWHAMRRRSTKVPAHKLTPQGATKTPVQGPRNATQRDPGLVRLRRPMINFPTRFPMQPLDHLRSTTSQRQEHRPGPAVPFPGPSLDPRWTLAGLRHDGLGTVPRIGPLEPIHVGPVSQFCGAGRVSSPWLAAPVSFGRPFFVAALRARLRSANGRSRRLVRSNSLLALH